MVAAEVGRWKPVLKAVLPLMIRGQELTAVGSGGEGGYRQKQHSQLRQSS